MISKDKFKNLPSLDSVKQYLRDNGWIYTGKSKNYVRYTKTLDNQEFVIILAKNKTTKDWEKSIIKTLDFLSDHLNESIQDIITMISSISQKESKMTPEEFKKIRTDLKLTGIQLAEIICVNERTVRRWEQPVTSSTPIQPTPMACKVLTWLKNGFDPKKYSD